MFELKIISEVISFTEISSMAQNQFGVMVKAVVDIEKGIMAIGAELHSDEESALLDAGSAQKDLWGINIYPLQAGEDRIEFDSMINIRPYQGNRSRDVEDKAVRGRISTIVNSLIKE